MEDIKKLLAKGVKNEENTSVGEKSKVLKVSDTVKLTPIILTITSR